MNKGVTMKKWTRTAFKYTIQLSMAGLLFGQASSGYLAQKLMIENSLRTRISDALEKVIENRKYVIDVSVDLELSSAVENQTTYSPNGNSFESLQSVEGSLSRDEMANPGSVGLPIPGFDFTGENQQTNNATAQDTPMDSQQNENVVSRTQTEMRPSMASVSNMEISIILQEGAAPELIENIRQVVMVASRFNRTRGDVLSIMTASFRERRDEKSAETVLLKNIAEKLESLESQRERLGEVDWKQELENYKQNEEERRQEDRLYFQSQLAELESSARDQSYNQERQAMLRQDSVRLQTLNEEIQNLKSFLGADNISESEMAEAQNTVQEKLLEKNSLDAQIEEKLAMLDQVQAELDTTPRAGIMSTNPGLVIILSILGALVLILGIILIVMLMNRPKQPNLPPWMMYPPRRPKKKANTNGAPQPVMTQNQQPAAPQPSPSEDIPVLQSEVNDMKQAVVSMSVGQPQAANKIVKDWILEEAPPEPEPAPVAEPEEDEGKGKKKRKKK